ncbi:hypothetical protein CCACVL1_23227 [Corchorus capsularis]|uniref:Uncharacterized protein n=1 Tax=Corchorus capsularis TaxID=210143 RepID=A0A1R3GUN4_COCAP|nr:hypothetical protein CCACVL1_23227 [Corchorus capsularis]
MEGEEITEIEQWPMGGTGGNRARIGFQIEKGMGVLKKTRGEIWLDNFE